MMWSELKQGDVLRQRYPGADMYLVVVVSIKTNITFMSLITGKTYSNGVRCRTGEIDQIHWDVIMTPRDRRGK